MQAFLPFIIEFFPTFVKNGTEKQKDEDRRVRRQSVHRDDPRRQAGIDGGAARQKGNQKADRTQKDPRMQQPGQDKAVPANVITQKGVQLHKDRKPQNAQTQAAAVQRRRAAAGGEISAAGADLPRR